MVRQSTRRNGTDEGDMPVWAAKLIERFDAYSSSFEKSASELLSRVFDEIKEIKNTQREILAHLGGLESRLSDLHSDKFSQQKLLYSTLVKVHADTTTSWKKNQSA